MENMRERALSFDGGGRTLHETFIGVLCLALLGGLVRWMRGKNKHTLVSFFLALLSSAFVGLQAHFFMRYLGLSQDLQFALSGACGYSAGALLDAMTPLMIRWCHKRLGVEYPVPRRRAEDKSDAA